MHNSSTQAGTLLPLDEYNQQLLSQVHPADWVNPSPADCYDLVVIGAGTAGLVTAAGAAGLGIGLKVALIEKHLMGGDCLNVGCVPSKCLIRSGRVVAEIEGAEAFGVRAAAPEVDFPAVMARMRRLRAGISPHDSAQRFQNLGVDTFLGEARFTGPDTVQVGDTQLRFKKAAIATGARPASPEIPGLAAAGYLTNETVFSLTERPRRLAVIGGGPIGCELAQTFRRLGCEVVLFQRGEHLLSKEDPAAAALVQRQFQREGIRLVLSSQIQQVQKTPAGKEITCTTAGRGETLVVDEILVGAGRVPNVESLNLEAAGVAYGDRGIQVNDTLQTTNPRIFAAGDVCMAWKFTHAADAAARILIRNAFFAPFGLGRAKLSDLVIPRVTYTDPEVAHVGLDEATARQQGRAIKTIAIPFERVDRAIADGETEGLLKLHHEAHSDRIVGATIVARHAGEMISEVTTAMVGGIGLNQLATVIHPYPTQAEAIKKAADAYRRTQLTPRSQALLKFLSRWS